MIHTYRPNTSIQSQRYAASAPLKAAKSQLSGRKSAPKTARNSKLKSRNGDIPRFMQAEMEEYDNQTYLWSRFIQINEEIAQLQCEVKPLRKRYADLQNDILMQHKAVTPTEPNLLENPDGLNNALTTGDFSSAIVQFQKESGSLSRQLNQVRQLFSNQSLRVLRNEIEEGKNYVVILASSVADTESEIYSIISQMDTYKLSKKYEDIQLHKQKLYKLAEDLDQAIQIHSQLKSEHYILTDTSNEVGVVDEATIVSKLNRKLNMLRRKHFEQCELLISLRNKQMNEMEAVGGAMVMGVDSVSKLPCIMDVELSNGEDNSDTMGNYVMNDESIPSDLF